MTIVCPTCSARLQLDDSKVPARAFTVRCPKCQNTIHANPPNAANETHHSSGVASPSNAREAHSSQRSMPAPAYKIDGQAQNSLPSLLEQSTAPDSKDLVSLLTALLQHASNSNSSKIQESDYRRILVCVSPNYREPIARTLAERSYEVYVANDTSQAIERISRDRLDILILDPEFDPAEQGATFITREIGTMLPSERRHLFVVQISSSVKTGDAHAAFLNHVNLVLNPSDIEILPESIVLGIRDFNELYRDFNEATRTFAASSN
jgi:predicted Zn finger-like uncharacterized protein